MFLFSRRYFSFTRYSHIFLRFHFYSVSFSCFVFYYFSYFEFLFASFTFTSFCRHSFRLFMYPAFFSLLFIFSCTPRPKLSLLASRVTSKVIRQQSVVLHKCRATTQVLRYHYTSLMASLRLSSIVHKGKKIGRLLQ
jgi:hypothetical protein